MFKQQKAAVEELLAIARGLEASVATARRELDALSRHDALRSILTEEQRWLARTEDAVRTVRAWRQQESRAYWPLLAWRWAAAVAFALLASIAAGAGYVWAARPYADEFAYLRSRNAFADALETRMVRMTPAERRQLDALLKLPTTPK
jgi:hypothetical protein